MVNPLHLRAHVLCRARRTIYIYPRPASQTPPAERKRAWRQRAIEAGGKLVSIVLSPTATERLAVVCLVEQKTEKRAIEDALVGCARKLGQSSTRMSPSMAACGKLR